MNLYLAADHRGFHLKEEIKKSIESNTLVVVDCGAYSYDPEDDYVDYAAKAISSLKGEDIAILICGSGHGMDIVANRFPEVRAILGFNPEVAKQGREHENANVLILPSDWVNPEEARKTVNNFLNSSFSYEERHQRRLSKLANIGNKNQ